MKMKTNVIHLLSLPDDLIHAILLRLPVKSLLRLKSVCKSLFSLISDPKFAKLHFDLAAAPTHQLFLRCSTAAGKVTPVEIETLLDNDSVELVSSIQLPSPSTTDFMGSCRGFILLTNTVIVKSDCYFDVVVWNPSTGQHRIHERFIDECIHPYCGIAYDSSTDDYLVVIVKLSLLEISKPLCTKVDCLSLRTNSWSHINGTVPYYHSGDLFKQGSFLNGALHWMVFSHNDGAVIIAFNVRERRWTEIPLPYDLTNIGGKFFEIHNLRVMGECLCLCVSYDRFRFSLWTMKEYKVQTSWTMSLVVSSLYYPFLYRFQPICFTKTGEILGSGGHDKLLRLNENGDLFEVYAPKQQSYFVNWIHRQSLLSLPELEHTII